MMPDICVARLSVTVDPQDGSYMPTRLRVSGGNNYEQMKELKMVNISLTGDAADITLLLDIKQVV